MGLAQDDLDVLRLGALLHDIGKIGISDAILTKPTELSAEEFEGIKRHTLLGAHILRPIGFLAAHVPIVELHHERPDGAGYPHGLRNDDTPIHARIVHVADAFDAMTTARAYRTARPATEAVAELWAHAGTDFDVPALQGLPASWRGWTSPRSSPAASAGVRRDGTGRRQRAAVRPPRLLIATASGRLAACVSRVPAACRLWSWAAPWSSTRRPFAIDARRVHDLVVLIESADRPRRSRRRPSWSGWGRRSPRRWSRS